MNLTKLKKRGSITDIPYIIAGMFALGFIVLMVTYVVDQIDDQVQTDDLFPTEAKEASTKMKNDFPEVMDSGTVLVFFGMCIASLLLASLVPVHPIFLVFYLIELLVLIWVGGGIANAYKMIIDVSILADVIPRYPISIHFFRYFPFVIGVFGIVLAIIMYKVKERFA